MYGMAEAVLAVTQSIPGKAVGRLEASRSALVGGRLQAPSEGESRTCLLSCGRAIGGVELAILGLGQELLDEGHVGRIAISAPFLFAGYFGKPEAGAALFAHGRYVTADFGLLWRGELYVVGRTDDMIIVHGKNVYAHDIEFLVHDLDGVKPGRAVAVGAYNANSGSEDLVVLCEADPLYRGSHIELEARIRRRIEEQYGLSGAHVAIVPSDSLIKTTSGKLARKANLERYIRTTDFSAHRA
jgi:fatty-acyl-CoA synthase